MAPSTTIDRAILRRGYGDTAHGLLGALSRGEPWQSVSRSVFNGSGSLGNGRAMRSAPIGAYFFDGDTTCAIVGGIVALRSGAEIPLKWLEAREPLSNLPGVT